MSAAYLRNMSGDEFRALPNKAITLIGMSGVGKTTVANRLPKDNWFHYSGDYRIGTKYLEEPILDNIKRQAMQVPFLRELLRSDSIYICSNVTVHNLEPLSTFLGKIGNPAAGDIKISAMVNGGGHDFLSNQFLGGLAAPQANLGGDGGGNFTGDLAGIDLNNFAGDQWFDIPTPGTAALFGLAGLAGIRRRR